MPKLKFQHLELTFPKGSLTQQMRDEIDAFYCGIFGWKSRPLEIEEGTFHTLLMDGQFILLGEVDQPMTLSTQEFGIGPGQTTSIPHLALQCDTREEVEELLEGCRRYQVKDSRVRIHDLPVWDPGTMFRANLKPASERAFYMNYLLPIWLEIVAIEWDAGAAPEKSWHYA
jgi:hypothetical protein